MHTLLLFILKKVICLCFSFRILGSTKMAFNGYDVQIYLWNMLKLSSKTCVTHLYLSSSFLLSFLLYLFFPLLFWILIYLMPLLASCLVARNIFRKSRHEDVEVNAKIDNARKKSKFATERVHSVRQRRAKEITRDTESKQLQQSDNMLETDLLKLHALLQQDDDVLPLQIRDIPLQQDDQVLKNEVPSTKPDLLVQEPLKEIREVEPFRSLERHEDDDDHKMEIGVSDTERTKRLESLIARRRSRKMLNIQARSSLLNKELIPNLVLPKIITYCPNRHAASFSPGPGSAPSILIPMRNPFDLPYDPQEEKPDLTGDIFNQDFTCSNNNYKDIMFSRHESFTFGNRDTLFSACGFGFRRAGRRFSRTSNEDDNDDDQIKQVLKVDENPSENESETRHIPQSDFNTSSSSSTRSSSEEDQPFLKISREAVLKSLSSMRRNALDNNIIDEVVADNLSYANSALENATRLKQQYYDEKPVRRHGHANTYSIASDMQVEVSEVSSPPQTIDEDGDREAVIYESVSRVETTTEDEESEFSDYGNSTEPRDEQHSSNVDSNHQQTQPSSTISPKSVLIPTLSLTNLDQQTNQDSYQNEQHIPESSSPPNDKVKIEESNDQSTPQTAVCSIDELIIEEKNDQSAPQTTISLKDELKIKEKNDQLALQTTISSNDKLKIEENNDQLEPQTTVSSNDDLKLEENNVQSVPQTIISLNDELIIEENNDQSASQTIISSNDELIIEESNDQSAPQSTTSFNDELKIENNDDQSAPQTSVSSNNELKIRKNNNESAFSVNEMKIEENEDEPEDQEEDTSSRSDTSDQNAYSQSIDQEEMVTRGCRNEEVKMEENRDESKKVGTNSKEETRSRSVASNQNRSR